MKHSLDPLALAVEPAIEARRILLMEWALLRW
jgi:hypothetical protein